jgi:hypothetical protein
MESERRNSAVKLARRKFEYSVGRRDFGIPAIGQPPPHYGQKLDPDGNPETDPDGNYIYVPIV